MPFQPAQDTALIEMLWGSDNGYRWQNNFHFTKPGFTSTDLDNLIDAVIARWDGSTLQDHISLHVSLLTVRGTDMRTEGAYSRQEDVAIAGQDNSDMLPPSAALVFTYRTALRGRSYRGRIYFAGIGESRWNAGEFETFTVGQIQDWLDDLKNAADLLGWTLVVLSRWHNHLKRAIALGQAVLSIVARSERAGSQRRRNQRG